MGQAGFKGQVASVKSLPRVPPLKSAGGGPGPESGRPPRGDIENLVFSEKSNGVRRMDYRYNDEMYYIEYSSDTNPNCYQFETRTVTNGGVVQSGEYCR